MKSHHREALRIAGAYALFGILWIFLSDRFLESLAQDVGTLATLQTWKGWGFILFTSVLIFLLSRRSLLKQAGLIEQVDKNQSDYHALFEQSPIGLALCHMDGSLVDVNPAFARILGHSVQETLDLPYWQIAPDSYASEEVRQLESLQQTGRYGPYEKEYLHADGHRVPVRLNGIVVERSGERLIWSSVEDITERKQAEEALRESSEKLRLFVHNAPSAIAMFDRDMRYIAFSHRWLADYGLVEQELAGRSHYLIFPDLPERWKEMHQRSLAGAVEKCDEDPFLRTDGSVDWVRWETRPWRTSKGEIGGIIIFSEVITERKQTQQIQQIRNEVLDQIIGNQPLPAILEHIAHQLELVHPEMHISILLLDAKAQRLTIGAAPSLPDFFNVATKGLKVAPGNGSCGTAAYLGETAIVEDIATHSYWAPYREVAARAGLGACWSVPFKDAAGLVLGTFAIYYKTPRTPTPIDLELIAEFSRITGLAVQKAHTETNRLEAERRFRASFEQSTMLMGIVAQNGLLMTVNQTALTVIGAQESDVIGQPFWDTPWWDNNPAQQERLKQALASAISGKIDSFEATHPKADGSMVTVECRASPILIGSETQVLVTGFDISERKRTEEALRQSATVFSSIHDGVMITDLNASILSVNPAFTEITGYTEAEVKGGNPRLLQSGRQDRSFYQAMWANLTETGHWQGEVWNRRKNGEIYPEWMTISSVYDAHGKTDRYVAVFSDISQIKQSEERLEHLAHYDALTQLPNRLLLFSRIEHSLEIAQRDNKLLALLMLDLDHFKDVNDSFGHLAGDELLQQVAERLTSRLRGIDTVCRLGGDEFTVLLEEISQPEDAARIANVIIDALSEPWRLSNGSEVRIGASVGISLFPEHANTAEELLRQADAALYQAKLEGRSRFKYFSEELTRAVRARITLEARLRQAIDNDELRVFYQPQVEIVSGRIIGAEALVRWQHPTDGLLMPGYFIPVAEETGLITPIGNWVLKETCRQGQRWIEAGLPPLALAVNLSPHQFLHSDIQQVVATALAETGFPATCLELELTESALMERETEAIQILNRLRELGVRLAIDDFGTGYSSLAYLKHFPLDVLKIDKSFIDDIPNEPNDMAITATIIAMAHTLGLKVLAEGVETKAQLDFLRAQGCDYYQGYLTSPPVSAEVFEKLQVAQN